MKWVLCTVASFLPLSAALSSSAALFLDEATAAFNIPKVPKVLNSDADGFPVLPTVGSLLTDASQSMKALSLKTRSLEEELQRLDQTSEAKLNKQTASYNQLLRKQEKTNQKMQEKNAERAKTMMGLRDTARKTQAEIKKEENRNSNQRAKLKSLQDELKQVQQATEDALSDSDDSKAPSRAEPDATIADEDVHVPKRGLSFLQVKPKTPSDPAGELLKESGPALTASTDEDDDYGSVDDEASAKNADAKVVAGAQTPALRSQTGHSAAQKVATPAKAAVAATSAKAATKAAKSASKPVQEHRAVHAETNVKISQRSQPLAPAEQSQEALMTSSDSTGVLSEGVVMGDQMAEGMIASLSSGVKAVQEQVRQSEANLKRHFQKAYRGGKKRHDALIKQEEALEISARSMQAQEQKLEATLKKLRATDKSLQQKISSIAGFLGKAIAPIGNVKKTV